MRTTLQERDRLILEHHGYAMGLARRMSSEVPSRLDVDDLMGVAVMSLFETVDRFDPNMGVPFRAYARARIRGAILDAARAEDWVPTSVRRKVSRLERARDSLHARSGRAPNREEMADALEIAPNAYDQLVTDSAVRPLLSLDAPIGDGESTSPLAEHVAGDEAALDQSLIAAEEQQALLEAIATLPLRERRAIELHHYKGFKLRDVGKALGVTESRACQLCKQGQARLRKSLRPVS